MWFIQSEMLPVVLTAALLYMAGVFISDKLNMKKGFLRFCVIINLFVLYKSSAVLCNFYIVYTVVSYIIVDIMRRAKRGRKALFVVFCLVLVIPFFAYRIIDKTNLGLSLPVLVGFSYNMLKAVDALFYTYYTEEKISALNYFNFILFFPVLTAGPIFRYRDFYRELENLKPVTPGDAVYAIKRFILGLFKKLVLVALITKTFEKLIALPEYTLPSSLAILVLSYLLLYFDLSGYSDMAVGIGKLCGFTVPENFKKPWTAASFTQFWRKWHVTLSDWIREHIFVVVRGKRLNKYQSAIIGFVTMIVMSLWHEFSVVTIVGGVYMGLFLVIENIFSLSTFNVRKEKRYKYIIRCTLVSFFFAINALTFSVDTMQALRVLKGLIKL